MGGVRWGGWDNGGSEKARIRYPLQCTCLEGTPGEAHVSCDVMSPLETTYHMITCECLSIFETAWLLVVSELVVNCKLLQGF